MLPFLELVLFVDYYVWAHFTCAFILEEQVICAFK